MESQQQLFSHGLAGLGIVCCTIECVRLWKYHALGASRERGSSVHILVLWLTHIVSVYAADPLPSGRISRGSLVLQALHVFTVLCIHQANAVSVLPAWMVMLLAEVHTIVQWLGLRTHHGHTSQAFHQLLLYQVAGVVLPAVVLQYTSQRWGMPIATRMLQQHQPVTTHMAPTTAPTAAAPSFPGTPVKPPAGITQSQNQRHASNNECSPSTMPKPIGTSTTCTHSQDRSCSNECSDLHIWHPSSSEAEPLAVLRPNLDLIRQSADRQVYQSMWGKRQKVCIKIATHHDPVHVHRGAVDQLAKRVSECLSRTSRRPVQVLGGSVRYGCILINLDVCASTRLLQDAAQPGRPRDGSAADTAHFTPEEANLCARQLLPRLLQDLGLGDGDSDTIAKGGSVLKPSDSEQYLSLQLDRHVVTAVRDADGQAWTFSTRSVEWCGSTDLPRLCLAEPCPGNAKGAVSPRPAGMFAAAFHIQVWCPSTVASAVVVGSSPETIRKSTAKSNKTSSFSKSLQATNSARTSDTTTVVEANFQQPSLQLWVRCQGQYLCTTIEAAVTCPIDEFGGASAGGVSLLYAVVELPVAALARHHQPDGPLARVQLLMAELWYGDALLSTTPLLLDVSNNVHPAINACSFGWWGASCAHAAGMVQEVALLVEETKAFAAAYAGTPEVHAALASHEDFVSDMVAWLVTMQRAASGTCCDYVNPDSKSSAVGLPIAACKVMGSDLQAYVQELRLPCTKALLHSQHAKVLLPWLEATATAPLNSQSTRTAQQVRSSAQRLGRSVRRACTSAVCMRRCSACDDIYHTRLRLYLRQASVYVGIMLASATLLVGRAHEIATLAVLMSNAWAAMHLVAAAGAVMQPQMERTAAGGHDWSLWLLRGGGIQGISWVWHICIELSLLFGLSTMSGAVCKPATMGAFLASHTAFVVLSEQIHVWGRWPGWAIRIMQVVEAIAHQNLIHTCPAFPRWFNILFIPASALVLPYMLDCHWRSLLMSGTYKP